MKIKCKVSLKNENEIVIDNEVFNGLKNDNKIVYYEKDIKVSILLEDKIILKRSNEEYEIKLIFDEQNETEGKYLLKKDNLFLPLYTITDKIIVGNNLLLVNYCLNDEHYEFKLEFEVI